MSKFMSKTYQGSRQISASDLKLETSAEKSIGKEINVVNGKDFNHLDLIIEAKNNRLKSEFFYIYDYEKFNNCSLLKDSFDVFAANQINHNSSRYVIHYLTIELKKRFKEITGNANATKQQQNMVYDIFKPSLGQFDDEDIQSANDIIRSMFPYEGCSYTGAKLENLISKSTWMNLILSLRIIWSLLPNAIIPWKSYHNFEKYEQETKFSNRQSFYQVLPTSLPTHNHSCILFEFLEILLYLFADNYFLDSNVATDLIYTAGQICFNRDEFKPSNSQNDDDLNELQQFYYKRGHALYHIFISYLRSLSEEPGFTQRTLLETFKIDEYPPKPYKPVTQKALTLTVQSDEELTTTNYFKLISNASNATSRIYSSNHTFTKFENKFLDKFEINPHRIIEHFFSKSSKNYLLKFDKNLNFDNFKVGNDISKFRENLKNGTLFDNKELISTFINDFSRYGFEKGADPNNASQNESFVADTINFNFNSNMESVDNNPVRISKLQISEWFINAWKYETFLGFLQNTVILKLTKTIGDCDWLIITSNDKVSTTNRYLTPPNSAEAPIDHDKEKELSKKDNEESPKRKSELLPPLSTKFGLLEKKNENKATHSAPIGKRAPKRTSPKKANSKRISFPSPPKDIAIFENAANPRGSIDSQQSSGSDPKMKKIQEKTSYSYSKLEAPVEITKKEVKAPSIQAHKPPSSSVDAVLASPLDNQSFKSAQESRASSDGKSNTSSAICPPPVEKDAALPEPVTKDFAFSAPVIKASSIDTPPPITKSGSQDQKSVPSPKQQFQALLQPPSKPRQRFGTPPHQVSKTFNNPPPILKDDHNTNSLNSNAEIAGAIPRMFQSPAVGAGKSPAGSSMRFGAANGNTGSHPYSQLQHQSPQNNLQQQPPQQPKFKSQSIKVPSPSYGQAGQVPMQQYSTPPSRTTDKFESTSPSPQFNFTKPLNSPTSPSASASQQPANNKSSRFSNLASVSTKDVQKHLSPSNSPITTALPRFFKKSSNKKLPKMSNSESSNSLSHINDGSATGVTKSREIRQSKLLINNPELNVNADIIPEIPYTPKALRESAKFSDSKTSLHSEEGSSSSTIITDEDTPSGINSNASDFDKLLSDTRANFMGDSGNSSAISEKSLPDLVESNEADDTQDTTKTPERLHTKVEQDIDGLLEEIKESIDSNEKFFSTDDLLNTDKSSVTN